MNLVWELRTVRGDGAKTVDSERLRELLADNWEPFAVTALINVDGWRVHLRRRNDPSARIDGSDASEKLEP